MAKFKCKKCGAEKTQWQTTCPRCGHDPLVED